MKYFEQGGWWLPDAEEHLKEWLLSVNQRECGRLAYQYKKYVIAMRSVKQRRLAVDVGAHAGLWSWYMAKDFNNVMAFEPVADHRACWAKNMEGVANAKLFGFALGNQRATVKLGLVRDDSATMKMAVGGGKLEAQMVRLDEFNLQDLDFLKVDCEGYELFVLQGAKDTLKRCKPVVIVEQKPANDSQGHYGVGTTAAVAFLETLGAKVRGEYDGDYVMRWSSKRVVRR